VLLVGLNDIKLINKGIHDNCSYTCEQVCGTTTNIFSVGECNAHRVTYNGLIDIQGDVVCLKPIASMWHNQACLMGEFGFCGVEILHLCPEELILENVIKWKNIGYDVVGQTPEGKEKKTLKVFYHETPFRELISNLKPRLQSFMTHNFVSKWQEHQFKSILGAVPSSSIISCVDF
jgi:hypothetical protein